MIDVSVIIISHRKKLIGRALESLHWQTMEEKRWEYFVVHSLDPWIGKQNRIANHVARGKYLTFLCDDDQFEPTFLEKTFDAAENEKVDIVYTDVASVRHDGKVFDISEMRAWSLDEFSHTFSCPTPGTYLISRYLWNELKGFKEGLPYADWDFVMRACELGYKGYHLQQPLFLYYAHEHQASKGYNHIEFMLQFFMAHPIMAKKLFTGVRHELFGRKEMTAEFMEKLKLRIAA